MKPWGYFPVAGKRIFEKKLKRQDLNSHEAYNRWCQQKYQ